MAGRLMVHALKIAAGYDDISVVARGVGIPAHGIRVKTGDGRLFPCRFFL